MRCRLDHAAADEVDARVAVVRGNREEAPDRAGLLVEQLERHLVAVDAVGPYLLGGLCDGQGGQRMVWISREPVGEQVAYDPGQRRDALHVAGVAAVAGRHRLVIGQQAVREDLDVPELAGHAGRAADDLARLDHPAAEPGADDGRHRGMHRRIRSEVDLVRIQGGGVAVVVVDDRQPDARLQRAPHVEAPPGGLREVRGTPGADDAHGACRPGRVQPDRRHPLQRDAGLVEHEVHRLGHRLDGGLRALADPARDLVHPIHQEAARCVEHRGVVLGGAVVDPDDDPVSVHASAS